jgi:hypothetical protein
MMPANAAATEPVPVPVTSPVRIVAGATVAVVTVVNLPLASHAITGTVFVPPTAAPVPIALDSAMLTVLVPVPTASPAITTTAPLCGAIVAVLTVVSLPLASHVMIGIVFVEPTGAAVAIAEARTMLTDPVPVPVASPVTTVAGAIVAVPTAVTRPFASHVSTGVVFVPPTGELVAMAEDRTTFTVPVPVPVASPVTIVAGAIVAAPTAVKRPLLSQVMIGAVLVPPTGEAVPIALDSTTETVLVPVPIASPAITTTAAPAGAMVAVLTAVNRPLESQEIIGIVFVPPTAAAVPIAEDKTMLTVPVPVPNASPVMTTPRSGFPNRSEYVPLKSVGLPVKSP